ncbi:MAG: zinc ribbon domain-containing protein [Vicinamibacterales bacterium]
MTGTDRTDSEVDAGFRPWHFFVLASLVAATAAVILSRRATPENLIFISLAIGASGAAAAALYRTLAPFAAADPEALGEPLSSRARAALEREKALVLRSLKELEFDQAMGKLSPRDFDDMSGRLRGRALLLIKQLDEGGSGYRGIIERELQARMAGREAAGVATEPDPVAERLDPADDELSPAAVVEGTCPSCATVNDADAAFCKRCGTRL